MKFEKVVLHLVASQKTVAPIPMRETGSRKAMMTLREITRITGEAAMRESIYDGYAWDIDPKDILTLLVQNTTHLEIFNLMKTKCRKGGPIWLLATAALEKHAEAWPNDVSATDGSTHD